jgi:RHS repeat-associated protein
VLHNGTTTKYYNTGSQRVAMRTGSTLYYLLNDDLGGTSLVLTSGGGVQAVQLYAPYGAVRYSQGTIPTTYNYTGQRLDSETGLLYYGFRYYDPVVGQFVRADSVETNAGGMDGYSYVGGNPETKTDPTGHYIVGAGGQTYHPGSSYYTQGGEAYSVQTGNPYNGNGFSNGWRSGYGTNAATYIPIHLPSRSTAPPSQARSVPLKPILSGLKFGLGVLKGGIDGIGLHANAVALSDLFAGIDTYLPAIDDAATISRLTGLRLYPNGVFQSQLPGGMRALAEGASKVLGVLMGVAAIAFSLVDLGENLHNHDYWSAAIDGAFIGSILLTWFGQALNNEFIADLGVTLGLVAFAAQLAQAVLGFFNWAYNNSRNGYGYGRRDQGNGGGGFPPFPPPPLIPNVADA